MTATKEMTQPLKPKIILSALRAFRNGDFSTRLPLDLTGIEGEIAEEFNTIMDIAGDLGKELSRVARVVGQEGIITQRGSLTSAKGSWSAFIEAMNLMADNLAQPLQEVGQVITSVSKGDLQQKMLEQIDGRPLKGEFARIAKIINAMVDQLGTFASEVTRVAREVGTEGQLGGQSKLKGVTGIWKELTDSVNFMAKNLTDQVRSIAEVTTAVATGDLSRKITVDASGEIEDLKNTINAMVDQLGTFASEVTRVAREVGTEGILGGQAAVKGAAGIWKDLTDNVNSMANNLTAQVRSIAEVTTAVARGDLSRKITVEAKGEILELRNTINTMVNQLNAFASEVTRVAREVGTEGILGGQAEVEEVAGIWRVLTNNVNSMAKNLTDQVRNIAEVTIAVANGDLSRKITVEAKGEILELKETINTMVEQLNSFSSEVTRVAREVGTEGKLGAQAKVEDVAGIWKDLTDNVNSMADNLTSQVRNIAEVTTGVANGDLTKKIIVEASGEILELKKTINTMVDQLNGFASEVTRVAREVGTEGILGGQAKVEGVSGTWKELTKSVNSMADNLTGQVRNIAEVTTAVAKGDLSKTITVQAKGEIQGLKNTINLMVALLGNFASEVTRVARQVGAEGKLGGQASVEGVTGIWKDLTDNVNFMAKNLTEQVRGIAEVTTAVATGDLSRKIIVEASGEIQDLKNTINTMVDQLNAFASEVTRVAREVGLEGKLGGLAKVEGVAGIWKDLTDNVNSMANNLTGQVRNIAEVTKAVASGDLSRKITVEAKGEILELGNTINTMVDQLNAFSSEVTRVAREVGTEGILGGQAKVEGVAGVWQELTANVNFMANNLTGQVRNIAEVTTAVANGDLSRKITVEVRGEILELKNTINTMVDQLNAFASEVTRVAREVGADGKLGGQAEVFGVSGTWKDLTDNVNFMANNLTEQVRGIAEVTTAVATGDLSKKIIVKARGEILDLTNTINKMVDQLNAFASEVTRVAREVGTDGKLGGQAAVTGVAGTWKDLTDNVNTMAMNLTNQVRGIAKVVTAVANGDLKRKLQIEARGEIETLTNTINSMIETLATFADQVTYVAREVGVEGKLGGQANVPGAAGIWKDLTENVNQLANNLTTQVRAITEVATAVTQGDLSRSITVEAKGEVSELKDNINEMISNLKDTTQKNEEQGWLKSNIARFTGMMQGQRDMVAAAQLILSEVAPLVEAQHGVFYVMETREEIPQLKLISSYAYKERKFLAQQFGLGEGLVGQAALEKKRITVQNVPADYVKINSGLGEGTPYNIVVLPVVFEDQVKAVIELATFHRFKDIHNQFLEQLSESIGIVLETISATMRTEQLLAQSQNMAKELQMQQEELRESNEKLEQQANNLRESEERLKEQQEELQQTNEELTEKAQQLQVQNTEVEKKNYEIELARQAIEEKAEQLNLSNKYKSEFLANMSHELRTPLNSIMLLSNMLKKGELGKLEEEQVKQVAIINEAGKELLQLINEVLDLSKIEAGKMDIRSGDVNPGQIAHHTEKMFRQQVRDKGLEFLVEVDKKVPDVIQTDGERLQQVIRNFISNALKFTEKGKISFKIHTLDKQTTEHIVSYWILDERIKSHPEDYVVFSVTDTGMGIARDSQTVVFEAFQQLDGSIRRRYGGTGLGLSICKGIADALGGAISLRSQVNKGSTFSLVLPVQGTAAPARKTGYSTLPSAPAGTGPIDRETRVPGKGSEVLMMDDDDRDVIYHGEEKIVLIVEDDVNFAGILKQLARKRDYKVLHAVSGTEALRLATEFLPTGIMLDIKLPIIDGWEVLRNLKQNPTTRHIPVHILSVVPDETFGYKLGAIGYLVKPISTEQLEEAFTRIEALQRQEIKNILLVEDNDLERESIVKVIADKDASVTAVATGKEALKRLETGKYDAFIMDLRLPDIDGFEILKTIDRSETIRRTPTIVYTAKELTIEEERELRKYSESIILKTADSHARLLEDTTLFLHRIEANLGKEKREMLAKIARPDTIFEGKTILLTDDDIRTTYALTTALENRELRVLNASDGEEALKMLDRHDEIDLVLMDIMMPVMDGYEAITRIRAQGQYRDLPIIAVTAKAMKEDRAKCIAVGASDYISKPVDYDQLFSLIRVWLSAPRPGRVKKEDASTKSKPDTGKIKSTTPAKKAAKTP